jgi:predicted O-methyltransferase YrrM
VDPPFDQTAAFFDQLGLEQEPAYQFAEEICAKNGMRFSRLYSSCHFLAFAALAMSGFAPRDILEIGTGSGQTTRFLAELFPEAQVHTVELPLSDPIYGENAGGFDQDRRNQFLDRPQITAHSRNTAFLFDLDLPDFDLIWLDGGHVFPEVAWDHFYCLSKLRPGGWIFTDDIRLPDNPLYKIYEGSTDAYETLAYYAERTAHRFFLLLKRTDLHRNLFDPKYVGAIHKAEA